MILRSGTSGYRFSGNFGSWILDVIRKALFFLVIYSLSGCLKDTSFDAFPLNSSDIPNSGKILYGRKIYLRTCIKCHRPLDLRKYSDDEWRAIIHKKLSKDPLLLTEEETDSILYFLTYGNSGGGGLYPGKGVRESIALEPELEQ